MNRQSERITAYRGKLIGPVPWAVRLRLTALRRRSLGRGHCRFFAARRGGAAINVGRIIAPVLLLLVCLGPAQAWAEQGRAKSAAESAIRNALAKWTTDFNARRAEAACSLFAPDLRYDVQGLGERGYDVICRRLHASLADMTKHYRYELRVKEVLVAGDLAVVRLVWQLRISPGGRGPVSTHDEIGMDVFRHEPDGAWRIIRFLAYEARS